MVEKSFLLEDLRVYSLSRFSDVRPIRRAIDRNGGYVISDSGSGLDRRLIYAAPHSLHRQFLDEIAAFEAEKVRDNTIRLEVAQAAAKTIGKVLDDYERGVLARLRGQASQLAELTVRIDNDMMPGYLQEVMGAGVKGDMPGTRRRVFDGWFLEHPRSSPYEPLYFAGWLERVPVGVVSTDWPRWTYDYRNALRFPDHESAEAAANGRLRSCRIARHLWSKLCETVPPESGTKPAP